MSFLQQALDEKLICCDQVRNTLSSVICIFFGSPHGLCMLREHFIFYSQVQVQLFAKPAICFDVLKILCSDEGLIGLREHFITVEMATELGADKLGCVLSPNGIIALRMGYLTSAQFFTLPVESLRYLHDANIIATIEQELAAKDQSRCFSSAPVANVGACDSFSAKEHAFPDKHSPNFFASPNHCTSTHAPLLPRVQPSIENSLTATACPEQSFEAILDFLFSSPQG